MQKLNKKSAFKYIQDNGIATDYEPGALVEACSALAAKEKLNTLKLFFFIVEERGIKGKKLVDSNGLTSTGALLKASFNELYELAAQGGL